MIDEEERRWMDDGAHGDEHSLSQAKTTTASIPPLTKKLTIVTK